MSAPLLDVRGLCIETAASPIKPLVRSVSFEVRSGEVTCLVGESGSGKSLSCLSVPGLLPQGVRKTAGEVRWKGAVLDDMSPEARRQLRGSEMAMVLQNPMSCFDPIFSIGAHFEETLAAHGVTGGREMRQKAAATLAEVGLEEGEKLWKAYPFQLSGGMLQRVMLAMALLFDPKLLIADEATTDLDAVAQARVLDLIDDARKRRGMGVLLVTHDFGVVARLADEVMVMEEGVMVERGESAMLFEKPQHPCTKALVAAHENLSARLVDEEGGRR